MTTIPEKYARIILTAVKMGDTGSVPLEQLVAENIERAIEEAGGKSLELAKHVFSCPIGWNQNSVVIGVWSKEEDVLKWVKKSIFLSEEILSKSNTANASYPTQPE